MLELIYLGPCGVPTGIPEEDATVDVVGSALARVLLLEKKDVGGIGNLEVLELVDVIDGFRERDLGILSPAFGFAGFSVCLADRKPNAPREAIVAAWLATAMGQTERRILRATWATTSDCFRVHVE